MLRFSIAFALMRAGKLVHGLRQGLSEAGRYLVADDRSFAILSDKLEAEYENPK